MLSIRSVLRILFLIPILLSLGIGVSSCGSSGNNLAKGNSPSTVLSIVGGNVYIAKSGSSNWSSGKEGMTLQTGDKIKTDAGGKATITFFDGSIIDLYGDTEISLDDLTSKSSTSSKIIKIGQTIGETNSTIMKLADPASRYEIDTPSGVAAVRGSKMVVQVVADGTTSVYNLEGNISLTAQGQEVTIPVGSVSSAKPGAIPSAPQPGLPPGITTSQAISISSLVGWQQTGLYLNTGEKFYVDYRGGSWTVDFRNFPYVGPAGYSSDVDKKIVAGAKLISSEPYGYLLGKVGNGSVIPIGSQGGPFTTDGSGYLSLRINDIDSTLGDNDGAITVALRGPLTSGTSQVALTVPVTGSGGFNYTQGTYLEGFEFKANSQTSITHLGAYDSNYSHLPNGSETFAPAEVAVYDITTHSLLGSITVKASDPVTGVYHYTKLDTPISLNTADNYAVVWVSGTNYYIASPTLTQADVNSVITYLGFVGNGSGGLTQTKQMVEPNWFYTMKDNGISALNYDLGPNFMFVVK